MGNIGGGYGSSYPGTIDTQTSAEVDYPNPGYTRMRAEVPNDIAAAALATEQTLGTTPQGTKTDVKTFLQVDHNTDGTHKSLFLLRAASDFSSYTQKATPVDGDVLLIEDSTASGAKKYTTLSSLPRSGRFINVQRFTTGTAATYTPTVGTTQIIVELIGGGGGGGGGKFGTYGTAAGGGGGGGYLMKLITGVSGTGTYTVGGGGNRGAGDPTAGNGGNGGDTSFTYNAVTYTAYGGSGGIGDTGTAATGFKAGGAGGATSANGDVNCGGRPGDSSIKGANNTGVSGGGANSRYGAGGGAHPLTSGTGGYTGSSGGGYGSGGCGGVLATNGGVNNSDGGLGAGGLIIIREYR